MGIFYWIDSRQAQLQVGIYIQECVPPRTHLAKIQEMKSISKPRLPIEIYTV